MDTINVQKRDPGLKANHVRKAGFVPCSVYGGALEHAISIQMAQQDANNLLLHNGDGSKVQLKLDGEVLTTQIKEATRNFNNRNVEHISFQALKAGQPVNSVVHIHLANAENCPGIVEHMTYEVAYTALPRNMIESVTVDLAGKGIGTVITLADIPELNTGKITMHLPSDSIVLRIMEARTAPVEEETEAAE